MSNNSTWFQQLYDDHKEVFFGLLEVAKDEDIHLRLSITPDGVIKFSGDSPPFNHTIMQDSDSIRYTQFTDLRTFEKE